MTRYREAERYHMEAGAENLALENAELRANLRAAVRERDALAEAVVAGREAYDGGKNAERAYAPARDLARAALGTDGDGA